MTFGGWAALSLLVLSYIATFVVHTSSLHQELSSWIYSCLRKADKDKDDKLSQSEVKNFLRMINIEVDDTYADILFQVTLRYVMFGRA